MRYCKNDGKLEIEKCNMACVAKKNYVKIAGI